MLPVSARVQGLCPLVHYNPTTLVCFSTPRIPQGCSSRGVFVFAGLCLEQSYLEFGPCLLLIQVCNHWWPQRRLSWPHWLKAALHRPHPQSPAHQPVLIAFVSPPDLFPHSLLNWSSSFLRAGTLGWMSAVPRRCLEDQLADFPGYTATCALHCHLPTLRSLSWLYPLFLASGLFFSPGCYSPSPTPHYCKCISVEVTSGYLIISSEVFPQHPSSLTFLQVWLTLLLVFLPNRNIIGLCSRCCARCT